MENVLNRKSTYQNIPYFVTVTYYVPCFLDATKKYSEKEIRPEQPPLRNTPTRPATAHLTPYEPTTIPTDYNITTTGKKDFVGEDPSHLETVRLEAGE